MELWTLGELAERVEAALADYPGQVNGRVRAVPDQRAIRWYTTTGLIDRPAEMRGRTALYGRRHLLQLVAIKRRQAQGHTLAQIQSELAGATNESLQPIAALPDPLPTPPHPLPADPPQPPAATLPGDAPEPARSRFWADQPQTAPQAVRSLPGEAPQLAAAGAALSGDPAVVELVTAIRLAAGVTVVLEQLGAVPDPARLAVAAGPLVAELVRQGLVRQPSSGDES